MVAERVREGSMQVIAETTRLGHEIDLAVDPDRLGGDGRYHRMTGVGETVTEHADLVGLVSGALINLVEIMTPPMGR